MSAEQADTLNIRYQRKFYQLLGLHDSFGVLSITLCSKKQFPGL